MLEPILTILAELGLIREDYKHHKKITKKEKADGKKRPFQRYFLQPSSIMLFTYLAIGSIGAFLFFTYQRTSVFPEKTHKEIIEIGERIEKWNEKFGKYPIDLNELIGKDPMRQEWKKDAWNRPYKYTVTKNGKSYSIVSSGIDGKFETEDDIKMIKQTTHRTLKLVVTYNYGQYTKTITEKATPEIIKSTMQSINWNKFHIVQLEDENADGYKALDVGGSLGDDGLASGFVTTDDHILLEKPITTVNQMTQILLDFLKGEEYWRNTYSYK